MVHDAQDARPGDALLHPIPLIAIAVLLLNDHVLKAAFPGFVTGKLSDVAGLVFFPLFLVAAYELLVHRIRGEAAPSWPVLIFAAIATALGFSLVQIWPPATQLYRHGLGALQWPVYAVKAWIGSLPPPGPITVQVMADPTDLLAVPAVLIAVAVGRRRLP